MKYSKAVAIAVAALSVVSLASAEAGTTADHCVGDHVYLLDGACIDVNPLPRHTVKHTVNKEVEGKPEAHANTIVCVANAEVETGKKIQVDGCACKHGENTADNTCNAQPAPPAPKNVDCSVRYAIAPDATKPTECICGPGTLEKDGKCHINEGTAEGCLLFNRKFTDNHCGECVEGSEVITNPKNPSEPLGKACYKKNIPEAECKAKANETHREYKDGFCLCQEGYTFNSTEDVSSKDYPCYKSSAATLILSSTALFAFIGSLAYLI